MKKINCQFQGKIIRQFSKFSKTLGLQLVTWGGGCLNYLSGSLNNNNTFFRHGIRAG